jgi:hypothetical protein
MSAYADFEDPTRIVDMGNHPEIYASCLVIRPMRDHVVLTWFRDKPSCDENRTDRMLVAEIIISTEAAATIKRQFSGMEPSPIEPTVVPVSRCITEGGDANV